MKYRLICVALIAFASCKKIKETKANDKSDINLQTITSTENELKINNIAVALPEIAMKGCYMFYPASSTQTKSPVILVPGLGLSHSLYTSTPDDRESWAETFSNSGHDVYVYNDPSIFVNPSLDYSVYSDEASNWGAEKAWTTWGMGSTYPVPFENTRYPVNEFDALVVSFPKYTSFSFLTEKNTVGNGFNGTKQESEGRSKRPTSNSIGSLIKVNNLLALINKVGNCVLIVHSASGITGFEAIKTNTESIQKLVVIEPVGSPTDKKDIEDHFSKIPFLGVYGDFVQQRGQTRRKEAVEKTIGMITKYDGNATMLDLPEQGIYGNTHLLMQDDNNTEIAKRIITWIEKN